MKKVVARFSSILDQSKLENESQKAESMNNIMATDEYKVKSKPKLNMRGMNFILDMNPKCSK